MWQFDWGFALDKMLALDLALPDKEFVSNWQRVTYFEQLVQRMETLPGVNCVATNGIADRFSLII